MHRKEALLHELKFCSKRLILAHWERNRAEGFDLGMAILRLGNFQIACHVGVEIEQ